VSALLRRWRDNNLWRLTYTAADPNACPWLGDQLNCECPCEGCAHQCSFHRVAVCIDLNVRTHGNQTFTDLRDVEGPIVVGQDVEVYESESGIYGPGRVTRIDRRKGLVYLAVEWAELREPDDAA